MNRVLLLIVLASSVCQGQVKVAILMPTDRQTPHTVGNEVFCGLNGVLKEAINDGLDLKIEHFDNKRDPLTTAQVVGEIISKKFDLVLGTTLSSQAIVAAKALNEAKIAFFAPLATNPKVTDNKDYVIRLPFSDTLQAQLLGKYSSLGKSAKKILIVYNASTPYSSYIAEQYTKYLAKNSTIDIKSIHYIDGNFDPEQIFKEFKQFKPDILFAPIYSIDMANLYSFFNKQKTHITLLGADAIGGRRNFFDVIGEQSKYVNLEFVKHNDGTISGPESIRFHALRKKYCPGNDVNMNMAAGYDIANISVKAIKIMSKAKKKFNPLSFVELVKSSQYQGLNGLLIYGQDGEPIKPLFLYRLNKDRAIFWKKFS